VPLGGLDQNFDLGDCTSVGAANLRCDLAAWSAWVDEPTGADVAGERAILE
jgi:hypothetical protein